MTENYGIGKIKNIKSNVVLKKPFNIVGTNKKLKIVNYNKELQDRLNIDLNDYRTQCFKEIKESKSRVSNEKIKGFMCNDYKFLIESGKEKEKPYYRNEVQIKLPVDFISEMSKSRIIGPKKTADFIYDEIQYLDFRYANYKCLIIPEEVLKEFKLYTWMALVNKDVLYVFPKNILNVMENSKNMGPEVTYKFIKTFLNKLPYGALHNISQDMFHRFDKDFLQRLINESDIYELPANAIDVMIEIFGYKKMDDKVKFVILNRELFSEEQFKNLNPTIIKNFSLDDLKKLALTHSDKYFWIKRNDGNPFLSKLTYLTKELIVMILKDLTRISQKKRLAFVKEYKNRFSKEQITYAEENGINLQDPNLYNMLYKENDKNNNNNHNSESIEEQNKSKDDGDRSNP